MNTIELGVQRLNTIRPYESRKLWNETSLSVTTSATRIDRKPAEAALLELTAQRISSLEPD
jgi:hypothetical protein